MFPAAPSIRVGGQMSLEHAATPNHELTALAAEAYIYGFSLVFDLQEVERFTQRGLGSVQASPFNTFGHATGLATPDEKFVSINNDTIYSIANIDVSGGPVRFDVPDARGRYYVMQFIDAWTNNFAYVGHRATGTDAASFLLVGPGWEDEAPSGATVIRFPTAVATILGRWAVDGEDDLSAVCKLQEGLKLTHTGTGDGLPEADRAVHEDLLRVEIDVVDHTGRQHDLLAEDPGAGVDDDEAAADVV